MFTTRKLIAGAVSGVMCLSMLAAGVAAIDAPKTSGIKVDGVIDEAYWGAAEWMPIANVKEGSTVTNDTEFAVAWDDSNLYVAVKVIDDTVVYENLATSVYCNDGIELFFDADPAKPEKYTDSTIHLFYQIADDLYQIQGGAGTWDDITADHKDIVVLHKQTDDGYTVEASVPFKDISIDPAVGAQFSFNIGNNDDDNPDSWADADRVDIQLGEVATFNYKAPSTWTDIVLGEEFKMPEPEPTPSAPSSSANTFDLTAVAAAAAALSAAALAVSKKKSR